MAACLEFAGCLPLDHTEQQLAAEASGDKSWSRAME